MSDIKTDRLFQEKLGGLRVAPPPNAWKRVKANLEKPPPKPMVWWRSGWLLIALLGLCIHLKEPMVVKAFTPMPNLKQELPVLTKEKEPMPLPKVMEEKEEPPVVSPSPVTIQVEKTELPVADEGNISEETSAKLQEALVPKSELVEEKAIDLKALSEDELSGAELKALPVAPPEDPLKPRKSLKIVIDLKPGNKEPKAAAPEKKGIKVKKIIKKIKDLKE